jgi:protein tyrosine/serine phosphatase
MSRRISVAFGLLIAAILVTGPAVYINYMKANFRNIRVVRHGVLYRSGQLSRTGLKMVLKDFQVRTVVSLRYADSPDGLPPDADEEKYCRERGIRYVRIRPRVYHSVSGPPPADQSVDEFLKVVDDPSNYPILIHCFAGMHRTGAYCAIYRIEYEQWSNRDAMIELQSCGYERLHYEADVRDYLLDYRPRRQRSTAQGASTDQAGGANTGLR